MTKLTVKIKGSPLKNVTGQYVRDLVVGDIYVHHLHNVLLQVTAVDPIEGMTDAYRVTFTSGLDGDSRTLDLAGDTVCATRRSITAEEANGYFDGVPDNLADLYAHLRDV